MKRNKHIKKETMAINDSFKTAFDRLPYCERSTTRHEIMEALNITSRPSFLRRMNGEIEHTRREARAIEEVFSKHGINQVWG